MRTFNNRWSITPDFKCVLYVIKWKQSKNEEAALHIQVTLTERSNVESYLELTKQISTVDGSTKRSQGNKKNSEKHLQY